MRALAQDFAAHTDTVRVSRQTVGALLNVGVTTRVDSLRNVETLQAQHQVLPTELLGNPRNAVPFLVKMTGDHSADLNEVPVSAETAAAWRNVEDLGGQLDAAMADIDAAFKRHLVPWKGDNEVYLGPKAQQELHSLIEHAGGIYDRFLPALNRWTEERGTDVVNWREEILKNPPF
jgi:hypothetical protein